MFIQLQENTRKKPAIITDRFEIVRGKDVFLKLYHRDTKKTYILWHQTDDQLVLRHCASRPKFLEQPCSPQTQGFGM